MWPDPDRREDRPPRRLAVTLTPSAIRAFRGRPTACRTAVVTGVLGEALVTAYLALQGRQVIPLGGKRPFDLLTEDAAVEVKAGLVSNSARAQVWRLTIGEPGPTETAWFGVASPGLQRASNAQKQRAIHARKQAALQTMIELGGHPLRILMVTAIIDPDRHLVDVYEFVGLHDRIAWRSVEAARGYRGSYSYTVAV